MQFLSGLGRYFETPQAYEEGERFDITGVDANYQAPVAGFGRYFEDSYGIRHGERFEIAGANKNYQAPLVGGVGRYMLDDTAFGGMGAVPQTTVAELQRQGLLGMGDFQKTMEDANPYLLLGIGALVGGAVTYFIHQARK